jgi:hypothetical protein
LDSKNIGNNIIGRIFPEITSKSLAGDVVTLPAVSGGKATVHVHRPSAVNLI